MKLNLKSALFAGLVALCAPGALHAQSGIDARAANTTLGIKNSEKQAATTYGFAPVFPRLTLPPIVMLRQHGDVFYAMAFSGQLFRFPAIDDPDPANLEMVLNLASLVPAPEDLSEVSFCVALDPNFDTNHYVYVNYASKVNNRLTISRFTLGGSPTDAAATEQILIRAEQPTGILHYGGTLEFGPDGYFYISTGDGNSEYPNLSAQDPDSYLGKILRIDLAGTPAEGLNYAIPASNPFVNVSGYKPEIWALGLRNPYRFSFDAPTERLFQGDPGEDTMEEVDIIKKGGNYGWPFMEGTTVHMLGGVPSPQADRADLIRPIHTYAPEGRHAMIGGFVYRGTANQGLVGRYLFGDFIAGKLFALELVDDTVVSQTEVAGLGGPPLMAISRNTAGEVYVTALGAGIFKLVPDGTAVTMQTQAQGLLGNGPVVDLNADGTTDAADVTGAGGGKRVTFFSHTN